MISSHWDKPNYIIFMLAVFIVMFLLYRLHKWRAEVRAMYADTNLQEAVFSQKSISWLNLKNIFLLLSLVFLVIALMGPLWGEEEQTLKREGIDIVFALDLSNSMNAEDIAPSRLEKAKKFIIDYVETLGGDRVGLVIFAGEAYAVSPLTTDYMAINSFVASLDTNLLWNQGTNISAAIRTSLEVLGTAQDTSKAIILISDGEDHEEGIKDQIANAKKNRTEIFALGIGESVPVPIPMRTTDGFDAGYKEDDNGSTVLTSFHGENLRNIAELSGGSYIKVESLESTIKKLQNGINTLEKKSQQEVLTFNKKHQYQWFLGISILFFFIYTLTPDKRILNT